MIFDNDLFLIIAYSDINTRVSTQQPNLIIWDYLADLVQFQILNTRICEYHRDQINGINLFYYDEISTPFLISYDAAGKIVVWDYPNNNIL
jgi:hypothetical protein